MTLIVVMMMLVVAQRVVVAAAGTNRAYREDRGLSVNIDCMAIS